MKYAIARNEDISDLEIYTGATTGNISPIPAEVVRKFGWAKVRLFMHKYGLYTMPTTELIEYLRSKIAGRRAIEIGAGMGVIGRSLGIPLTDSRMQERPDIKAYYEAMRQPVIKYPADVEKLEALEAVRKYRPEVVIGSFITYKWREETKSGNYWGVDTLKLIHSVPEYYMIGNLETHHHDPALKYLTDAERPEFLFTRGNPEYSLIFHWKK